MNIHNNIIWVQWTYQASRDDAFQHVQGQTEQLTRPPDHPSAMYTTQHLNQIMGDMITTSLALQTSAAKPLPLSVPPLSCMHCQTDIQGTTVNWVGQEPRLACCMCDNYQQAINTQAAPRFLLQPMQYSPVCGHMSSQCFDEGDRSNWADRWFHGTRVGTRLGHTGPGYPSTRVLTSLISGIAQH